MIDMIETSMKFYIGQTVYHKTNPEELGIVTGILHRPGSLIYFVTFKGPDEKCCYEMELTDEKEFQIKGE